MFIIVFKEEGPDAGLGFAIDRSEVHGTGLNEIAVDGVLEPEIELFKRVIEQIFDPEASVRVLMIEVINVHNSYL